jgi:hypothetical protein
VTGITLRTPKVLRGKPRSSRLIRIAVSARAYRAIKATLGEGSVVYPPERNGRGEYLLWLNDAEANRLAALRRHGESYSGAVIRMARAQGTSGRKSHSFPFQNTKNGLTIFGRKYNGDILILLIRSGKIFIFGW